MLESQIYINFLTFKNMKKRGGGGVILNWRGSSPLGLGVPVCQNIPVYTHVHAIIINHFPPISGVAL